MGKFTSTTDHNTALKLIQLPRTESKRLHLVGVKARVSSDISFVHNKNISISIKSAPFDGPKGIWVVNVKGVANGKTTLEAKLANVSVASVEIQVFNKVVVSLPLASTVEGMLTRLFLAESINPGNASVYDAVVSKKSMLWMRQVIENRLNHKTPQIFDAKKKTGQSKYTVYDIVQAKNQFHGFENYPALDASIKVNLDGFIAIANNYHHPKREDYVHYIENAVSAASNNALKNFTDPSAGGLYGWRTKGSSSPGGTFKVYQDLGGQTFYTLKK